MTIQLQSRGIKDDTMRRQVAADLEDLNRLITITSAQVALQHQRKACPPCQAMATLVAPGLDIYAAARDYTWPAAWRKAVTRLREQVEQRQGHQPGRRKRQPCIQDPARSRTGQGAEGRLT